jgi:hypothetical protein
LRPSSIDTYNFLNCRRISWYKLLIACLCSVHSILVPLSDLRGLFCWVLLCRVTSFSHVHSTAKLLLNYHFLHLYAGFITVLCWSYSIFSKDMEYTPYTASSSVSHIFIIPLKYVCCFGIFDDYLLNC